MTDGQADWPEAAQRLGEIFPRSRLDPSGIPQGEQADEGPMLVSVSGGGDSLGLFLLLWAHFSSWRERLEIVTFDHRTRSGASSRDVKWVQGVGEAFGCEVHCGQSPESGEGLNEEELRTHRRAFQKEVLSKRGAKHLFTGHHREDVLESMLMRLCRGSGSEGASGPRPRQSWGKHFIWRPLLSLDGSLLQNEMRGLGIPFCEDETNQQAGAWRNRLRHRVVPVLREVSPFLPSGGAARMRRLLEEDANALRAWAESWLSENSHEALPRKKLRELPTAVQRRVLLTWLGGNGKKIEASLAGRVLHLIPSAEKVSFDLDEHSKLVLSCESLAVEPHKEKSAFPNGVSSLPLIPGTEVFFPEGRGLRVVKVGANALPGLSRIKAADPSQEAWLDVVPWFSGNRFALRVGFWEPGHRFQALGAPGSRKLADWFIDRKIPEKERHAVPVVSNGEGEVLWVPGFPPAQRAAVREDSDWLLHLTYL